MIPNRPFYVSAILLTSVLVLTGCQEEIPTIEEDKLPRIEIASLETLVIDHHFERPASIISLNNSQLSAEITARVNNITVNVGQAVSQGDLLVELNCTDEKNRLKQAQAQLAANAASVKLSKLDLDRAEKIYAKRSLSKQEVDSKQSVHSRNQAEQRNAQASLALAKNNISKCNLLAPFSGVITERNVAVGQLAQPGTPLVRLVDTESIEVSTQLTSDEIHTLTQSTHVNFKQQGQIYHAHLARVTPVVNSLSRTQEVRLAFSHSKPLPGSAGDLSWLHPQPILPGEYVSVRGGQSGLLYLTDSQSTQPQVHFLPLADVLEGQPVPIRYSSLLSKDLHVITSGRFGISAGDDIELAQ